MLNIAGGIILAVLFFVFIEPILALGIWLLIIAIGIILVGLIIIAAHAGISTFFTINSSPSHSSPSENILLIIPLLIILCWSIFYHILTNHINFVRLLKRVQLKCFDHKPGCVKRLAEFEAETERQKIAIREIRNASLKRQEKERLDFEAANLQKMKEAEQRKKDKQKTTINELFNKLLLTLKSNTYLHDFQITTDDLKIIISHPLLPNCYLEAEIKIYDCNNISYTITRVENGAIA